MDFSLITLGLPFYHFLTKICSTSPPLSVSSNILKLIFENPLRSSGGVAPWPARCPQQAAFAAGKLINYLWNVFNEFVPCWGPYFLTITKRGGSGNKINVNNLICPLMACYWLAAAKMDCNININIAQPQSD